MLKQLLDFAPSEVVYIQLWKERIKVTNLMTDNAYDQASFVHITTLPSGKKKITSIGDSARTSQSPETLSFNPLGHPRSLLSDFQVLEEMLKQILIQIRPPRLSFKRLVAIIHPMERIEGGLTAIEERGLKEVVSGAGAHDAFTYVGGPISPQQILDAVTGKTEQTHSQNQPKRKPTSYRNIFGAWLMIALLASALFFAVSMRTADEIQITSEIIIKHAVIGIAFSSIGTLPILAIKLLKDLLRTKQQ